MVEKDSNKTISPEDSSRQLLVDIASAFSEGGTNQVRKLLDSIGPDDPRHEFARTASEGLESRHFLSLDEIVEKNRRNRDQYGRIGPNCSLPRRDS
jgi:hypothetical protein